MKMVSKASKRRVGRAKERHKTAARTSARTHRTSSSKRRPVNHSASSLYTKHALQDAWSIRVIDIHTSEDLSEPVKATMRVTRLPTKKAKSDSPDYSTNGLLNKGDYQTLSYTWGTAQRTASITIDGCEVPVTPNLESGLRRFREQAQSYTQYFSMTIWIDAICINQADLTERAQQVSIMGEIYDRSANVVIWLGEASESDTATLRSKSSSKKRRTAALKNMLTAPWFQRRWVIQEALSGHGSSRWFLYGSFTEKASNLINHMSSCLDAETLAKAPLVLHPSMKTWSELSRRHDELLTNLLKYRHALCQEPLDRVYALLGISRDRNRVEVDYTAKTSELYLRLARQWLEHCKSPVAVLVCATVTTPLSAEGEPSLPSWVPNWNHVKPLMNDQHRMAIQSGEKLENIAGFDTLPLAREGYEIDNSGALIVQGWIVRPYCNETGAYTQCACCDLFPSRLSGGEDVRKPRMSAKARTARLRMKQEWPRLDEDDLILYVRLARFGFVVRASANHSDAYTPVSCFLAMPDSGDPDALSNMKTQLEMCAPSRPIRIL